MPRSRNKPPPTTPAAASLNEQLVDMHDKLLVVALKQELAAAEAGTPMPDGRPFRVSAALLKAAQNRMSQLGPPKTTVDPMSIGELARAAAARHKAELEREREAHVDA